GCPGCPCCQTDRGPARSGSGCAVSVQIALCYLISWQSSFFRSVGLGYYVGHSAIRLQDPEVF
ncbi:hypothetical protein, partial [Acinetobacter baumannii]|uniref:hypothetical protein n=1 Tax=Acinetobacter baumannii TaxID=470 RepID=UPI001C8DA337